MAIRKTAKKKGFSYQVRYYDDFGKEKGLSFAGTKEGLADATALDATLKAIKAKGDSVEAYLSNNGFIEPKNNPIKKDKTASNIATLCDQYLLDRKVNGKSPEWIRNQASIFANRLKPEFKDVPLSSITYEDMMRYVSKHWEGANISTINRNIMAMKSMFNWGIEQGYLHTNPLAKWKKNKEPKYSMQLTVPDFKYLLTFCPPHLKWALYIAYETGIRPGKKELFRIKFSDVDYLRNQIRVLSGKGGYYRLVDITEKFKEMISLARKHNKTEYLIEYNGKPVDSLQSAFSTARKKAGLPYRIRMYDIRHLFATSMLNAGADLAAVSALLGHHSIEMTTQAYYHCMPEEKQKAISLRPEVDLLDKDTSQ